MNYKTTKKRDNNIYSYYKGQSVLEPPQRMKEFLNKNAIGWEKEFKEYQRLWLQLAKEKTIREYPLHIELELSTDCNLKCPMCYTLNDEFQKNVAKNFMDINLFKKIIDEIAGKVFIVRLNLRGEPTLHPQFVEAIRYAKSKGINEVSSLTNASKLSLDFFIECANAGLDRFTISVDGLKDEYEKIRKPLKFVDTFEKIKNISEYKTKNNLQKPVIKIQGVWPAIKPNPTEFYKTFAPITDLVAFNPLADWRHNDDEIIYDDNFSCSVLYQRLVVGSDGNVLMCIYDENGENIIGNANEQTIYEIWHGDKLNKIREIHSKGDFQKIDICRKCLLPRKVERNETAIVEDREIWIENYVNRKQIIGE